MGSVAPTRPRAEQLQSRLQKDSRHVRPREVVPLRWVPDAMRCFLIASYRSAWRRRAGTGVDIRDYEIIGPDRGGWFATDFALNRNDTPYVIAQRLHCPLNRLSTLS